MNSERLRAIAVELNQLSMRNNTPTRDRERVRAERLRDQAEADLNRPCDNLGPLIGWADAMVELQLLDEMESA